MCSLLEGFDHWLNEKGRQVCQTLAGSFEVGEADADACARLGFRKMSRATTLLTMLVQATPSSIYRAHNLDPKP